MAWQFHKALILGLSRLLFTEDHALETAFIDVIKIVIMEELLLAALFQLCPNWQKMLKNAVLVGMGKVHYDHRKC